MIRSHLTFLALSLSSFLLFAQQGHLSLGTDYGNKGAEAYAQSKHGSDGALFVDPYFTPFLEDVAGLKVLDAGCGSGPWAIHAAQHGASVCALDFQQEMILLAQQAAEDAGVSESIHFAIGTVSDLPYPDDSFDRAISINVGCNLPQEVFCAHFKELYRTLKSGGSACITAPASFGILFTTFHSFITHAEIESALHHINPLDAQEIRAALGNFNHILRATFAIKNEKLTLISDEKALIEGEAIWRKIPGLAVPNFYHSEESYIKQLESAGFIIERIDRPRFESYANWLLDNHGLSQEYCFFHAFCIYHIRKP